MGYSPQNHKESDTTEAHVYNKGRLSTLVCLDADLPEHLLVLQWQDCPGDPLVKIPCFQCRGHGSDPWSGN